MRLVHFRISEEDQVYINPDQVVAIKRHGTGTRVYVSAFSEGAGGPSIDVPIPLDDVATALAGAAVR